MPYRMKFLSLASVALFGVASLANAQEVDEAAGKRHYTPKKGVRAKFTTAISGAVGDVTIYDSTNVSADITITDFLKIDTVQGWATCSEGGLQWSIQELWPAGPDELFGDECVDYVVVPEQEFLGGRYDPSFACSADSQYAATSTTPFCGAMPFPNVALFEYLDHQALNNVPPKSGFNPTCPDPIAGEYNCSPCLYKQFHLACEVGDFSGKYGTLKFHDTCLREAVEAGEAEEAAEESEADEAAGYSNYCRETTHVHFDTHDRFMDKPRVFTARALRLSCNDGTPLMCAKLKQFVGY